MTKVIRHKKDNNPLFAGLDILVTILSFFLAYFLVNLIDTHYFKFTREYMIMLLLVIPTWAVLLHTSHLTQIPRTRSHLSIFISFVNFSFIGLALVFFYKHAFGLKNFSHFVIIAFSLINLISLYVFRMITFRVFKYFRANGHNICNVVIYAEDGSEKLIDSLIEHREWGFRILMIITNSALIHKKFGPSIRVYPDKINIRNILDIDIVDEVIYCKNDADDNKIRQMIETCEEIGVTLRLKSELSPMSISNVHLSHLEHIPFITIKNTPRNAIGLAWKSFSDFWISFGILFMLSPIMLIVSILITASSKGPIIFRQERVGLRGRKFYMYKFRTMVQNAEALKSTLESLNESDGPTFKIKNDPRITLIGRFLRKTGLDELPQLFNVLKGEMSLIGPRPPLSSEVEKYERWHLRRLSVKPGITCTWQIIPNRNEVVFDSWMKLDIQYIDTWSIKKDMQLFFKTIKTIIYGTGY